MWYDAGVDAMLTDDQLFELLTECSGQVVLLDGPTGCGKTRMMKRLMNEGGRKTELFAEDRFIRTLMDCTLSNGRHTIAEAVDGYEIVCIDDADLMRGTTGTQEYTAQILSDIAQKALVILAGIQLCERIKTLIGNITAPVRLIEYRIEQEIGD